MRGWPTVRLGDACEITMGQSPDGDSYNSTGDGVPLINGPVEFSAHSFGKTIMSKFTTQPTKYCKSGDLILCVRGSTTGRMNIAGFDACIGRGVAAIRAKKYQPWINYFIRHKRYEIHAKGTGATFPNVSAQTLAEFQLIYPPLQEQERIVGILDQAFDGIATAKANAEKNLQNARAIFESHLDAVFSQRGEGWVETTIERISENLDSRRIPITKNVRKAGEYPYYGASGIVDYVADYIFDEDILLISEDGANLLARSTPIAFSVSGKCWVNNHAHILKFQNKDTQKYVELYINSIPIDEYVTGAAQPKLNQRMLNVIPIPIPKTTSEQSEIVKKLEGISSETQSLEVIYQKKIAALDDLKKSLLDQAFTGNL